MPTDNRVRKLKSSAGPVPSVAALNEVTSKYHILFDQASDAILTVHLGGNLVGTIDEANQAFEEMTGFLKNELIHTSVELLIPKKTLRTATIPHHRARPLQFDYFCSQGTYEDVSILRKDGFVRFVDLSVRLVSHGRTRLAVALFRDITEKKRMERELLAKHTELRDACFQLEKKNAELHSMQETLVQAGKMTALGELAAGIAHELNQPLQGIRGYAQELQSDPSADHSALCTREIISCVDKMAGIIDYLRTFTRKSTENHEATDVHHAIEEALKLLSRQFASRGIQVQKNFDPHLPSVYANPLQLEQIFINLATNARDAIEATGRGNGRVEITTRTRNEFVEIEYRDDGCGMTEKTKTKAFNPFFTTKEVGKGMGMGLSLSYGILTKLHGSIVVESELGKGAAFLIRIPKDFRELA